MRTSLTMSYQSHTFYDTPLSTANRTDVFDADDALVRSDPRYRSTMSWNRAAGVSLESHYTPLKPSVLENDQIFPSVGEGSLSQHFSQRGFGFAHQNTPTRSDIPAVSTTQQLALPTHLDTRTSRTPTKVQNASSYHQRHPSPTKIEGFSVDHRRDGKEDNINHSVSPSRTLHPIDQRNDLLTGNKLSSLHHADQSPRVIIAHNNLTLNQEVDETLHSAYFARIPPPFGSDHAHSIKDSIGIAIITSLMESQGINPDEHEEMVAYHAAPPFISDLELAIKGEYLTRYHLLRNCDKTGPDPVERFISLQVEQPAPTIKLRTHRRNPFVYVNVRAIGSPAAETISRAPLSDLVGVTRDVCNPAFGPHRIFVDGTIGHTGVAYESIPVCPDPDGSSKQSNEEYRVRQLQLLQEYKEKVVGMRGQRFATTGKHRLLHADNAFTLWFYNVRTMQATQMAFCAHSATSADFWVTVFKGILSVNSGRVIPIPVPTAFNDGGRIGKAGTKLQEYQARVGNEGGEAVSTAAVSRSPSNSQQAQQQQQKLSKVNSGVNFNRTNSTLTSFFADTPANKERKIAAQIKKNDKQMKREYFLPRPVGINADGETVGEDGLTEKERELMQSQQPALPYLFRKARHLIDLRNAQTQYFEVK